MEIETFNDEPFRDCEQAVWSAVKSPPGEGSVTAHLFVLVQSQLHVLVTAELDIRKVLGLVVVIKGDFGSGDLYTVKVETSASLVFLRPSRNPYLGTDSLVPNAFEQVLSHTRR